MTSWRSNTTLNCQGKRLLGLGTKNASLEATPQGSAGPIDLRRQVSTSGTCDRRRASKRRERRQRYEQHDDPYQRWLELTVKEGGLAPAGVASNKIQVHDTLIQAGASPPHYEIRSA